MLVFLLYSAHAMFIDLKFYFVYLSTIPELVVAKKKKHGA